MFSNKTFEVFEPNDISTLLFQKCWYIIGSGLYDYVLHDLNNNMLHDHINFTYITLFSKIDNSTMHHNLQDFGKMYY